MLKIEKPGEGDSLRQLGTRSETGDSYFWLSEARNKKCITLDLRKPRGADLFRRMVKKADVVIENFRPGTLEKWGLGFADLLALNQGLDVYKRQGVRGLGLWLPRRRSPHPP